MGAVLLLGSRIRELRTAHGLNQVAFAAKLSVTKQTVSNWENSNILPSIEMLTQIADFFHTTTDYLLGRDNKRLIDVSGLTEEQFAHINLIIQDIERE